MAGLYVHIPFCLRKCHYCAFVTTLSGSGEKHDAFLEALEKEITHAAARFGLGTFDTLYIGGGTPSCLTPEETQKLFDLLKKHFQFNKDAEITFEVNPGGVDKEKICVYKALGINRISLGAQTFNDTTLKSLNRGHDAEDILKLFRFLREAGFGNISLDLILSLPEETLKDVERSIKSALGLGAEHFSIYDLAIEEKTVFGRKFKDNRLRLPSEDEQIAMLSLTRDTLEKNGYRHYELLNYARPGFESRHNLNYWANGEYLGLGPGAFSYLEGRRFRNSSSYEEYMNKAQRADWTASEEETLTDEKKQIESLLLALRLEEGAELERFKPLLAKLEPSVTGLEEKGLLVKDSQRLRLTPRGQFLAETVFTELSSPSVR